MMKNDLKPWKIGDEPRTETQRELNEIFEKHKPVPRKTFWQWLAGDAPTSPIYSTKPNIAAIELIDGAYDIVELWEATTPAQLAWKMEWMRKARELGAHPSW